MTRWRDSQKACDGRFRGDRPQLFDRQRVLEWLRRPSRALVEACAIDEGAPCTVGRRAPFDMRARNATIARAQRVQGVKGQSRDR